MEPEPGSLAEKFDGWYADMTGSPVKDEIQQRHLGLPSYLLSTSLLGWDGIAEATARLRLFPGGTLVDLACGRGGYGLEIAARTGARLIGVDFSAEAVRQARELALRLGAKADFRVGDLAATGLEAGSADAVLCVDAIQFAPLPDAAYVEIRRVLVPGGRAVLTNWEPVEWDDQRLPDRLRRVDLGTGLTAAGFEAVEVCDRPGWRASERAMWQEARRSTPVTTRRCARSTTRAWTAWNSSGWSVGSSPPPAHRRPPQISFPSRAAGERARSPDRHGLSSTSAIASAVQNTQILGGYTR